MSVLCDRNISSLIQKGMIDFDRSETDWETVQKQINQCSDFFFRDRFPALDRVFACGLHKTLLHEFRFYIFSVFFQDYEHGMQI